MKSPKVANPKPVNANASVKLTLHRETVRALTVRTAVRTGEMGRSIPTVGDPCRNA